jgi:hypothetical protein
MHGGLELETNSVDNASCHASFLIDCSQPDIKTSETLPENVIENKASKDITQENNLLRSQLHKAINEAQFDRSAINDPELLQLFDKLNSILQLCPVSASAKAKPILDNFRLSLLRFGRLVLCQFCARLPHLFKLPNQANIEILVQQPGFNAELLKFIREFDVGKYADNSENNMNESENNTLALTPGSWEYPHNPTQ